MGPASTPELCAQLLGRAEDARAYVRHGAEEGFTEITLSGGAGERAVKVYHLIRSKGDRVSEWKLNGDPNNLYLKPKQLKTLNSECPRAVKVYHLRSAARASGCPSGSSTVGLSWFMQACCLLCILPASAWHTRDAFEKA